MVPVLGLCAAHSGGLIGLDFQPITVEVSSRRGPAFFQLAGLAETAVREARIRISSALSRMGVTVDEYALTVNLAPANVRKSGSGLDLAIALSVLGAVGHIEEFERPDSLFLGELALDGSVRPLPGVLPLLQGAVRRGFSEAFIPEDNAREAAYIDGLDVYPVTHLDQVTAHLSGGCRITPLKRIEFVPVQRVDADLSDVRGQEAAKRALIVGAAGHHHLLLVGPPGAGKSLLARRLPGLLPPLSARQALETTAIHSVAGLLRADRGIVDAPPFRAPHHTVSEAGLVGGGTMPRPGELSLAHHGVLFLDELPEFRRPSLEALRQPLEEHSVNIVRARQRATYPARPLVVSAMNPCPCGSWGSPQMVCRCKRDVRLRYLSRISGPLLDRIDLHVLVPPADLKTWSSPASKRSMSTATARSLVLRARQIQQERAREGRVSHELNSLLGLRELEQVAAPTSEGQALLEAAIERNLLSARGYVRVLRVARTLADLDEADRPGVAHIGEALRYRLSDLSEISPR